MSALRILFVALSVPYPPSNGHRLRNWALLQALAEEGHEVTLLSFAEAHELAGDFPALSKLCRDVQFVRLPPTAGNGQALYWGRLRTFFSPQPYGAWRFRSTEMRATLENLFANGEFDVVICDDIYHAQNLADVSAAPVLLNKHDITHVIVRRYLAHERNPAKSAYGWVEYWKLRRWEAQACGSFEGVLACSEADRALLKALCPSARVAVLPNVIDVREYVQQGADDGRTLLYVGAMDWYPNEDAVKFFLSQIFPKLETIPGIRFRIAGRNPSESLLRRSAEMPAVEFTGLVPDIRSEIAPAALCVVPLRIGSGTRLKILEAAAMQKSIVSTRIGAEGLHLKDGEEIALADQPGEFARAVAGLLADPARRRAMGQAARRRVEEEYSVSALRRALRGALEEFVRKPMAA